MHFEETRSGRDECQQLRAHAWYAFCPIWAHYTGTTETGWRLIALNNRTESCAPHYDFQVEINTPKYPLKFTDHTIAQQKPDRSVVGFGNAFFSLWFHVAHKHTAHLTRECLLFVDHDFWFTVGDIVLWSEGVL